MLIAFDMTLGVPGRLWLLCVICKLHHLPASVSGTELKDLTNLKQFLCLALKTVQLCLIPRISEKLMEH